MSAARTERLLNLLTLLLNTRRPITLREIREMDEFGAYRTSDPKSGERAFERDKAALVDLGVPLRWIAPEADDEYESEGTGGYIVDRERYYLPELQLSGSEVASLSIAGAAAVALEHFPGRDAVVRALAKLGFDIDESSPTATIAHSPLTPGADESRVGHHLETLHDAVARRRRVDIAYENADGTASEREVDPWGLYYRQGIWYLVGWCHLRKGERTFHLGRMGKVSIARTKSRSGEGDFDVAEEFDLHHKARLRPWEYPSEDPYEVTIRLAERLVPAIRELFGERVRVEKKGDDHLIHVDVSSTEALIAAVLPHGAATEVLSPPQLRKRIGDIYAELASRYEEAS